MKSRKSDSQPSELSPQATERYIQQQKTATILSLLSSDYNKVQRQHLHQQLTHDLTQYLAMKQGLIHTLPPESINHLLNKVGHQLLEHYQQWTADLERCLAQLNALISQRLPDPTSVDTLSVHDKDLLKFSNKLDRLLGDFEQHRQHRSFSFLLHGFLYLVQQHHFSYCNEVMDLLASLTELKQFNCLEGLNHVPFQHHSDQAIPLRQIIEDIATELYQPIYVQNSIDTLLRHHRYSDRLLNLLESESLRASVQNFKNKNPYYLSAEEKMIFRRGLLTQLLALEQDDITEVTMVLYQGNQKALCIDEWIIKRSTRELYDNAPGFQQHLFEEVYREDCNLNRASEDIDGIIEQEIRPHRAKSKPQLGFFKEPTNDLSESTRFPAIS